MEQENFNEEIAIEKKNPLFQVTPLSKYLALILFISMPFVGGWIGYTYAPEKVVEVERVVVSYDSESKDNQTVAAVENSNKEIWRLLETEGDMQRYEIIECGITFEADTSWKISELLESDADYVMVVYEEPFPTYTRLHRVYIGIPHDMKSIEEYILTRASNVGKGVTALETTTHTINDIDFYKQSYAEIKSNKILGSSVFFFANGDQICSLKSDEENDVLQKILNSIKLTTN